MRTQFFVAVADVLFNGFKTDTQLGGNLFLHLTLSHKDQDFAFTGSQWQLIDIAFPGNNEYWHKVNLLQNCFSEQHNKFPFWGSSVL